MRKWGLIRQRDMKIFLKNILILLVVTTVVSCVKTPEPLGIDNITTVEHGDVIVLCEGLMGYDNSELSLLKVSSGKSIANFYSDNNPNYKLGDTSNDGLIKGDTLITCSTGGAFIQLVNIKNAKSIKIIKLPEDSRPRKIAKVNDSIIAISDLIKSRVLLLNIISDSLLTMIDVGPQPEGIAKYNNYLFTANSAYGDFNYKHPDAQTISVIDLNSLQEIKKIKTGINPIEMMIDDLNKKLYVAYIHLPSKLDSMGGIIEYDLDNYEKLREWRCYPRSINLSRDGEHLYFINQMNGKASQWKGVSRINLENGNIENIIKNNSNDIWYGLNIDEFDGSIWIANAKNHISKGEVLVYTTSNFDTPIYKFETGINPNKVFFIKK